MKHTTVHLGENRIELHNSIFGQETIRVNNTVVSEKWSIMGTSHLFTVKENDQEVNCKLVTGFGINGVVFDLFKDEKPIIESPKTDLMSIFLIAIFVFIILSIIL